MTAGDNWTLVLPRRGGRRRQKPHGNSKTLPITHVDGKPPSPLPWTPSPSSATSPSSLLVKIHRSIAALHASTFRRRFLSQLRPLRPRLPTLRLVVYGVGSVDAHEPPRLQLALALLLHKELGFPRPLEIFDPVLSVLECAAMEELGCRVMDVDEMGRRVVEEPTLFYMPHCDAGLYDALLEANWGEERLGKMVILGNSFREYEAFVSGMGKGSRVDGEARYVVRASMIVEEVRIDRVEGEENGQEGDGDSFFKAFHLTSWHLFSVRGKAGELGLVENGTKN